MASNGQISVVQGERFEQFSLDDGISSVGDAIEKFAPHGSSYDVTVNGRKVGDNAELRDGDTILIVSRATASGGLKGAN